jgi:hypothetical protein
VDDRKTQVSQMQADLMGAAGVRSAFDEAGSVGEATADTKRGSGGLAGRIYGSPAASSRSPADRREAFQVVCRRVAKHPRQVEFVDLIQAELLLELAGDGIPTAEQHQAGGMGIQPVSQEELFRAIDET